MDAYSSGEELLIKARKPYTITKQRERWTEEEHNRFLEALKLYGRAWQRIEEHIGTKTAVQIRSHAQKFFSKLEKEALVKGVPVRRAIDIEIPPPRPKKKPSNPYPRKTGAVCSPVAPARAKDGKHVPSCSSHSSIQINDLEKEPQHKKHGGNDGEQNTEGSLGTPSRASPASVTEAGRQLSNVEFLPVKKPLVNNEGNESHVDDGPNIYHKPDKHDSLEIVPFDSSKVPYIQRSLSRLLREPEALENKKDGAESLPRHSVVQILDECQGACSQGFSSDMSYQEPKVQMEIRGHHALFSNPANSCGVESQNSTSRSSNHQVHPGGHPSFNPLPNNQEDYSSFLQMSSTFSSLIVSALLQNPAAHAAACFAASLWPSPNVGNSAHSTPDHNVCFGPQQAPSMAAIAAATVAAATAWWAAHGLLPLSAPFHSAFPSPSAPAAFSNPCQTSVAIEEKEENKVQIPDSQVQQSEHSASKKSSATSSSNSGNSGEKMDVGESAINVREVPSISEQKDEMKGKNKKQVDRSSCGSNTPSGSDAETDALGKNDKVNEESKEADMDNYNTELNGRRFKIIGNITDNWKEVSEEGRLAFRALFSKGRLPQSFSPPPVVTISQQDTVGGVEGEQHNTEQSIREAPQLDLNSNAWEYVSSYQGTEEMGSIGRCNINSKNGLLTSNRTGFKPYKRCSVEARESRMLSSSSPEQGTCSKRLRLEGDASI